jgi:hypothetical protein
MGIATILSAETVNDTPKFVGRKMCGMRATRTSVSLVIIKNLAEVLAYVRGQAYLLGHNGTAAAAEFQKLLDHRGIMGNFVTGSLAHLQIGRAYAMGGDIAKAKAAYQDFFTLWKDADPDIPILKEAKAEYAKVQ